MISYPYLEQLFTNVLAKSNAVQGRFFVSHNNGLEINSDTLGQEIADVVKPITGKKYPLVMMMPPVSSAGFVGNNGDWEDFRITLFFLTTTYYTGNNQLKSPNLNTQTSTHTVLQDWHDMHRCGVFFLRMLDKVQRKNQLISSVFRMSNDKKFFKPISTVGIDRVSGVKLDFGCSLYNGCEFEDYDDTALTTITVPTGDTHPEHNQ